MITCKYCGGELNFIGEYDEKLYFNCNYCDMSFKKEDTCFNRERKMSIPYGYDGNYYQSTKDLLRKNAVELFHLLQVCRKDWYETKKLVQTLYGSAEEEVKTIVKPLEDEYRQITKQKFIIENIILEKAGFIPEKITTEFLNTIVEQGENFSKTPMKIYIPKK